MPTIITTDCGVSFAVDGTLIYPLTGCCQASAKGVDGGIACRSCYEDVPFAMGDCANVADRDDVQGMVRRVLIDEPGAECVDAEACAEKVWATITATPATPAVTG